MYFARVFVRSVTAVGGLHVIQLHSMCVCMCALGCVCARVHTKQENKPPVNLREQNQSLTIVNTARARSHCKLCELVVPIKRAQL
jgi:hypothetical protein